MKLVEANQSKPASAHDKVHNGLHINILEFFGNYHQSLVVNLVHPRGQTPGGHVLFLRSDNTSALS
jgi:hypothetical protein